ncbi:hypothetical protein KJZ61_03940 [Candidatus Dependentiae bacterium]|nr:hypothetical protein [Candidatus Dependentiae bacterium]
MTKLSIRNVSSRHVYVVSCVFTLCFAMTSSAVAMGFDNLFCTSAYEGVFNQCMRLCGEIDHWNTLIQTEQDRGTVAELAMGKLLCLKQEAMALSKSSSAILVSDLEYLVDVMNRIEQEMFVLFEQGVDTQKMIITQLFDEIKALIHQRIAKSAV